MRIVSLFYYPKLDFVVKKTTFLAALVISLSITVTAVDLSGTDKYYTNQQKIDLEYEESGIAGIINVSYYNSSELIGFSTSSPYTVTFDSNVANYSIIDLKANVTNSSTFNTDSNTLEIDRVKPTASHEGTYRYDDGRVQVNYSVTDSETFVKKAKLSRNGSLIGDAAVVSSSQEISFTD